jgi:uncharacterized protein
MMKILLYLIKFYQLLVSPIKGFSSCRFIPSCSHYAYRAIEKHGAVHGSILSFKRIIRCHPFNKGGYDPVP